MYKNMCSFPQCFKEIVGLGLPNGYCYKASFPCAICSIDSIIPDSILYPLGIYIFMGKFWNQAYICFTTGNKDGWKQFHSSTERRQNFPSVQHYVECRGFYMLNM